MKTFGINMSFYAIIKISTKSKNAQNPVFIRFPALFISVEIQPLTAPFKRKYRFFMVLPFFADDLVVIQIKEDQEPSYNQACSFSSLDLKLLFGVILFFAT